MTDDPKPPSLDQGKHDFLHPRSRYYGKFTHQKLTFNAHLQDFSQRIGYICGLETGGKIFAHEAYEMIKKAWKELKRSKKGLEISQTLPSLDEGQ